MYKNHIDFSRKTCYTINNRTRHASKLCVPRRVIQLYSGDKIGYENKAKENEKKARDNALKSQAYTAIQDLISNTVIENL